MGTDLTVLIEVWHDEQWIPAVAPVWPDFRDGSKGVVPILTRNYSLFSVLGDVRNRSGRGHKTTQTIDIPDHGPVEVVYDTDDGGHATLRPIAEPRGIPDDATLPWVIWCQEFDGGYHDHSWLTLEEMLTSTLWDQIVYEDGPVMEQEYIAYRDHGTRPEFKPQGVGGEGMRIVTPDEYEAGERGENTTVVQLQWSGGSVRDQNSEFFTLLTLMSMLTPNRDLSKMRLLFVFDS